MKVFFHKVRAYVKAHPYISAVVAVAILGGGYWTHGKLTSTAGETQYVVGVAQRQTLVVSVSGSGQVSALNQIDLKPKVSGDVVYVGVTNGQQVGSGQLIAQLDATNAQKAVRDAQVGLESAKLSLQKLTQSADALSMAQAENSLVQASSTLAKAYNDGFNEVSSTFLVLPGVMSGLDGVLYGTTVNKSQDNISAYTDMVKDYDATVLVYRDATIAKYTLARTSYSATFEEYKSASRFSDTATIEKLVIDSYETTKSIADATKAANDFLNFINDTQTVRHLAIPPILSTHQSSLSTYVGQLNSHIGTLLSITSTIASSKQSIEENTLSLAKLKKGADPLDIQSSTLSVQQRANALQDAQDQLSQYYIRAPFGGTIAKLNVNKGDSASSGTVVATLITKQQIAQISLNEVDAAKIKVGQKATLTFDAVDGLSITGEVASIDTVGTVTQGVVTYTVKIGFDTQDSRVKSGMSVNAAIVTNLVQNVVTVPQSAVKTSGNSSYVQMFTPPLTSSTGAQSIPSAVPPTQVPVQVGLSNDTDIEITQGLKEGDQVVIRTTTVTNASATQAPSLLNAVGGRGGGGRIGG